MGEMDFLQFRFSSITIEALIPPGPRFVQNFAAKPPDGMDVILGGGGTER
jgi:hypothetical protein